MRGAPGIQLGDRVRFTHSLTRFTEHRHAPDRPGSLGSRQRWKVWKPEHAPYGAHGGIVVGRRTLANGQAEHEWEVGTQWYPGTAEHFRAYLVAWHLDKRPVLVLPEHLEYVDTVTIPRPTVAHGPEYLTVDQADASYFREASRTLAARQEFGSNLTATIAGLLDDVAQVLDPADSADVQQERL